MKEINLAPYPIGPEGSLVDEDQEPIERPTVDPRKFLDDALLSPILKHAGPRLLDAHNFVNRIRQHKGNSLLVDDKEYKQLLTVTNIPDMAGATMGFGENEVEMIRRILEAPEVEVAKKE